jgi:hypothetical protein
MFDELYENISRMFSRGWPTSDGLITGVYVEPIQRGQIEVAYEFSVGSDGPYTGQSSPPFWFGGTSVVNADAMVGQAVTVRYRRSDPSVNTLDRGFWQGLEGL